jgi:hypothetical protein
MFSINSIQKCRQAAFLRNRYTNACALALGAACTVLGALHFIPAAHAAGITWGTASPATETYFQSDGVSDFSTSWNYELGYFSGITPTATNTADWSTSWTLFDSATYAEVVSGSGVYWYSSSIDSPTSVATGAQAYVWIHDTKTSGTGSEWLLYTNDSTDGIAGDDWLWPSSGGSGPGSLDWTTDNASAVVFGGLSPDQGGGDFTTPGSSFTLQTHTLPVPEPTSALLLAVAGGIMVLRRRRREVA